MALARFLVVISVREFDGEEVEVGVIPGVEGEIGSVPAMKLSFVCGFDLTERFFRDTLCNVSQNKASAKHGIIFSS
jgi:hypothetical protein